MRYSIIRDERVRDTSSPISGVRRGMTFQDLHPSQCFTFPGIDLVYRKLGHNLYSYQDDYQGKLAQAMVGYARTYPVEYPG